MKQQSITTLPPSPEAERRSRMIKYTIAMAIRVACIFAMLFAQGWWLAVFAAGAIFLPVRRRRARQRERPVARLRGAATGWPGAHDSPGGPARVAGRGPDVPPAEPEPDPTRSRRAPTPTPMRGIPTRAEAPPHDERGAA